MSILLFFLENAVVQLTKASIGSDGIPTKFGLFFLCKKDNNEKVMKWIEYESQSPRTYLLYIIEVPFTRIWAILDTQNY